LECIADSQTISRHIRSERLHIAAPPGVGKTEICNVFTDYLLASDKLVRFDMSEYQTPNRFIVSWAITERKDCSG